MLSSRVLFFFFPLYERYYQYTYKLVQVYEFQLLMGGGDLINSEFSSVELSCSAMSDCDPMDCNTPGFPVHHQLLELAQTHVTESVMSSNYLILCPPLLLLLSIFPSIRVFSNDSVLCIRWPEYWSFSFRIRPFNEYSGLIKLGWTGCISLQSKGLSRVFSNTTIQKHQFFGSQLSSQSNSHIHT